MTKKQIPVYLFTGFLEAGKTRFIQETLEDERFNTGKEKMLLLVCEEGEEEYEINSFPAGGKNITCKTVENEEELTTELIESYIKESCAERVIVEYNGMWQIGTLFSALPEDVFVYQEMMFADSRTFINYNANMRSLVVDKLTGCELVVFNRYDDEKCDQNEFHKIVRATSRRTDIAYEKPDGSVEYDQIEDPLPFDVNADIIVIEDRDYALFYRDLTEEPDKYKNKTVRFKALIGLDSKFDKGFFGVGRHIMTCCEADIAYSAIIAYWEKADTLESGSFAMVEGKLEMEYNKIYRRKGPVLKISSLAPAEAPEQPVATFF